MVAPLEVDCVAWLRAGLAARLGGPRVLTELTSVLADDVAEHGGVVQLVPVGGFDDGYIVDSPRIFAHCFAADPPAARALALRVGTACHALVGTVSDGATMQSVQVGGLTRNDYPNTAVREMVRLIQPRIKTVG